MSRCKKCNKLMIFSRSSYCENCIKTLEIEASRNNKKDTIKENPIVYTSPVSTKYYKRLEATFDACYSMVFSQNQDIKLSLDPFASYEALELKRAGKYIESCKEYANAAIREKNLTIMMVVGWAKALCCGGSFRAAKYLYDIAVPKFLSDELLLDLRHYSLMEVVVVKTNIAQFVKHEEMVYRLVQTKDFDEIYDYLLSISGNADYTITPNEIDILDNQQFANGMIKSKNNSQISPRRDRLLLNRMFVQYLPLITYPENKIVPYFDYPNDATIMRSEGRYLSALIEYCDIISENKQISPKIITEIANVLCSGGDFGDASFLYRIISNRLSKDMIHNLSQNLDLIYFFEDYETIKELIKNKCFEDMYIYLLKINGSGFSIKPDEIDIIDLDRPL